VLGVTGLATGQFVGVVALLGVVQGSLRSLCGGAVTLELGLVGCGRARSRLSVLGDLVGLTCGGRQSVLLGEFDGFRNGVVGVGVHLVSLVVGGRRR